MPLIFILVLMGVGIYGYLSVENRVKTRGTIGRSVLSADEIYDNFFKDDGYNKDDALTLWKEISDALSMPQGTLRPNDQFGKDVGGGLITTPDLDLLSQIALDRAARAGISVELGQVKTVGDYVAMFPRKYS